MKCGQMDRYNHHTVNSLNVLKMYRCHSCLIFTCKNIFKFQYTILLTFQLCKFTISKEYHKFLELQTISCCYGCCWCNVCCCFTLSYKHCRILFNASFIPYAGLPIFNTIPKFRTVRQVIHLDAYVVEAWGSQRHTGNSSPAMDCISQRTRDSESFIHCTACFHTFASPTQQQPKNIFGHYTTKKTF